MKVLIVYHSVYGHIQTMAKAVQEGAQEVAGIDVVLADCWGSLLRARHDSHRSARWDTLWRDHDRGAARPIAADGG
jgi:hypothetical protein